MSLINKEILPFTAQAFDPKKDQFKEVTQEDLKGSWSVVCFYPADFSFVCPTELEDLQNQYEELQKLASEISLPDHNIHFGLVGTSDSFISNKELKKGILKNFPNMQVVEMEAAAIAQTCYQFGTKFIVCRSVSDKAEEGTRVTFDEFLQIAAVNSSILTTELIKKL